jgi:hypothetical protein
MREDQLGMSSGLGDGQTVPYRWSGESRRKEILQPRRVCRAGRSREHQLRAQHESKYSTK